MASVRFYLRSQKTDPALIMGRLYHSGTEFAFSTGYSVSPKSWNQKAQRVSLKERAANDINTMLAQKEAEILAMHDKLKRENNLTNDNLRRAINEKPTEKITLYAHMENVLTDIKTKEEKLIAAGKKKRRHMSVRYGKCYERLREFGQKFIGMPLILQILTSIFTTNMWIFCKTMDSPKIQYGEK